MFLKAVKVVVIVLVIAAAEGFALEMTGVLEGPKIVSKPGKPRMLEYVCTAMAPTTQEVRSVRLRLRPKGRLIKIYLGQGVTVEGSAVRTHIPAEETTYYSLPSELAAYRFRLDFSTNKLGDKAELRLVSGAESIVCRFDESSGDFAD